MWNIYTRLTRVRMAQTQVSMTLGADPQTLSDAQGTLEAAQEAWGASDWVPFSSTCQKGCLYLGDGWCQLSTFFGG